MMMPNIRTKQANEKWSLHPYNFPAGSSRTVRKFGYKVQRKTVAETSAFGKCDSPNIFFKN
jgi:hypothetical protein